MNQPRRTLGQLLGSRSQIPNIENLKNSEAAAWLMTPSREDGLVQLDSKNSDLKADDLENSDLSIIKSFSIEHAKNNLDRSVERKDFLSRSDEESRLRFQNLKQQSLTKDNPPNEQNYIINTLSEIFSNRENPESEVFKIGGTSLGEDSYKITFTLVDSEAGIEARKISESVLKRNNFFGPDSNRFYDSTKLGDKAFINGLYSLAPWPKDDPKKRFGSYSREAGKKVTSEELNKAADSMLEKAVYISDSEILNFFSPPIFVLQTISDIRLKNYKDFDKIKDDLNANDDLIKTDESILLGLNRTYGSISTPSKSIENSNTRLMMATFASIASMLAVFPFYLVILSGLINFYKTKNKNPNAYSLLSSTFSKVAFSALNELGINFSDNLSVKIEDVIEYYNSLEKDPNKQLTNDRYVNPDKAGKYLDSFYNMFDNMIKTESFESYMNGVKNFYGHHSGSVWNPNNYKNVVNSPIFYATISRAILRDISDISKLNRSLHNSKLSLRPIDNITDSFSEVINSFSFKFFLKLFIIGHHNNTSDHQQSLTYFFNKDFSEDVLKKNDEKSKKVIQFNRDRFGKTRSIMGESLRYYDHVFLTNVNSNDIFYKDYTSNPFISKKYLGKTSIDRISKTLVDDIEKSIDLEYVPFSIQDLRNNEIISLPAFLDSVTDSFAPNYETTNGFGRIDPVYSYSRTERSISLGFTLVAFNEEDHNYVYTIANKLVSMCYPQRSRGEKREFTDSSGKKFIFYQPFSQVQTASPMIRIRLGDLLTNNKSSFAMKSIFGDNLHHGDVTLTPDGKYAIVRPIDSLEHSLEDSLVGNIFSNSINNPIIRSFESTSGKGLAGFITSLSFDYDGSTWGTRDKFEKDYVDENKFDNQSESTKKNPYYDYLRAPKKIKITLNFAPIHDMPLGLDYNGRMLAPAFSVGTHNGSLYDSNELNNVTIDDSNKNKSAIIENEQLVEAKRQLDYAEVQAKIEAARLAAEERIRNDQQRAVLNRRAQVAAEARRKQELKDKSDQEYAQIADLVPVSLPPLRDLRTPENLKAGAKEFNEKQNIEFYLAKKKNQQGKAWQIFKEWERVAEKNPYVRIPDSVRDYIDEMESKSEEMNSRAKTVNPNSQATKDFIKSEYSRHRRGGAY